jgi:hypothetical protein
MDEFEQALGHTGVPYRRAYTILDTLKLDPRAALRLATMKPGDVFISPRGQGLELSDVVESSPAPLSGTSAQVVARALLARQAVARRLRGAIDAIVKAGKPEVQINDAYLPRKT